MISSVFSIISLESVTLFISVDLSINSVLFIGYVLPGSVVITVTSFVLLNMSDSLLFKISVFDAISVESKFSIFLIVFFSVDSSLISVILLKSLIKEF